MPNTLASAISEDCSKVAAIDSLGFLWVWSIGRETAGESAFSKFQVSSQGPRMKDSVLVSFISSRTLVVALGPVVLFVDADHMVKATPKIRDVSLPDPDYLISRVGLPCRATCLSRAGDEILLGTEQGSIMALNQSGRITQVISAGLAERLSALEFINPYSVLVGTDKGQILILDPVNRTIKSSWKSQTPGAVLNMSTDAKRNWFAASVLSGGKVSIVSGSTKSLIRVFESKPLSSDMTRCEFAQLASSGLSILVGGRNSPLTVLPLDLSTTGAPRNQIQGLFELSKSRRGELVSVTCQGGVIQLLSGTSLSLVRQLVVDS